MSDPFDYESLVRMLRGAIECVRSRHEELSRLDTFGGDGDHGSTMLRAMKSVEDAIEGMRSRDIQGLLQVAGWAILGVDGGATGPLLGVLLTGMSEAAAGKCSIDPRDLAGLFETGLAALERLTRARVGDKTMMDALVPAVAALRRSADGGADMASALRCAAEAAELGAAATENLQARFGRAKNLGPGSVGHRDPGAVSLALLFRGFTKGAV
jgi:dihydroxyacetone kinase-like protein